MAQSHAAPGFVSRGLGGLPHLTLRLEGAAGLRAVACMLGGLPLDAHKYIFGGIPVEPSGTVRAFASWVLRATIRKAVGHHRAQTSVASTGCSCSATCLTYLFDPSVWIS